MPSASRTSSFSRSCLFLQDLRRRSMVPTPNTKILRLTSLPKCIVYTGVKGSHSANKKIKFWIQQRSKRGNRRHLWSGGTGLSGVHRTVSGTPEDSDSNLPPSGISRGTHAIIHRTVRCTPDMSGAPRKVVLRNTPASGFLPRRSAIIHRTVRCAPDCPVQPRSNGYFAPTATCSGI